GGARDGYGAQSVGADSGDGWYRRSVADVARGVIRVHRLAAGRDRRPTYRIHVDGKPMGTVARGGTIDIEVQVGDHEVVASAGSGYGSRPLPVTVKDGQVVRLRCLPAVTTVTTVTTMIGLMGGKLPIAGIRLAADDDG